MTRPVVGIIACNRMVGDELAQAVMNRYAAALMRYADVAELIVPSLGGVMSALEVLPRLDGVLLTGSPSNIEGALYDAPPGDGPHDRARDDNALTLISGALDLGKPVLGICRGFQEINVAMGGTLRRDCATNPDLVPHHAPDDVGFTAMFDHGHDVTLAPDGWITGALGKQRMTVNSVHFQGIDRLGANLAIEARAADGMVEAVRGQGLGAPLLAVQWHPEWQPENNPDSRALFALMGRLVRGDAP